MTAAMIGPVRMRILCACIPHLPVRHGGRTLHAAEPLMRTRMPGLRSHRVQAIRPWGRCMGDGGGGALPEGDPCARPKPGAFSPGHPPSHSSLQRSRPVGCDRGPEHFTPRRSKVHVTPALSQRGQGTRSRCERSPCRERGLVARQPGRVYISRHGSCAGRTRLLSRHCSRVGGGNRRPSKEE